MTDTQGIRVVRMSGAVLLALGLVVLGGWLFDVALVMALLPGLATMKPNTALCFVLTGGALVAHGGSAGSLTRRAAIPLAAAVSVIAGLTVVEFRSGLDFGIDAILFASRAEGLSGPSPLRMSEITAVGFLLVGLSAATARFDRVRPVTQLLALTAAAVALTALVGYAYGVDALYAVDPFSSIALHTAIGLFLASVSLLWIAPSSGLVGLLQSHSMAGLTARRMLPLAIAVPFVFGLLRIQGVRHELFEAEFGTGLFAVVSIVVFVALVWGFSGWLEGAERRRNKLEAQLLHSQKLEALGQLTGGIAHDFNNQLSAIMTSAELAAWDSNLPSQAAREIEEIRRAAERAASLTRQLLIFSRRTVVEPRRIDVSDSIANMSVMLRRLIPESIDLAIQYADTPTPVIIDPTQLEQLVMNLVVNARDALPNGGSILIDLGHVELTAARREGPLPPGPYVTVEVRDDGTGIPEHVRLHVFEPFFTTKEAGMGTGLGLATCQGIVSDAGGHISLTTAMGEGTTFRILLPETDPPPRGEDVAEPEAEPEARRAGQGTILLVEDDDAVRSGTERLLGRLGYTVLSAAHGEQALELLRNPDHRVDLVLSDLVMPGMTGPEVVGAVREVIPEVPALFISGYADDNVLDGLGPGRAEVMQKPVRLHELHERIQELLG